MSFNLLSHCSRGFGSWGGAGASVHSISAYFVFFGWYIAESLSMRWSATLTAPTWYSVARPSKWSTPTPVSREKTVFLPTCGRPISAIFMKDPVRGEGLPLQALAKSFDAVETLLDVLHRTGVAEAHVRIAAESDAGNCRDFLFIQQLRTESGRVEAELGDIRQHIERAHRFHAGDTRNLREPIVHVCATFGERRDHLPDERLVALQSRKRAFLRKTGRVRSRMRLNGVDCGGDVLRCGDVAETPAGHPVRLADAIDGDCQVVNRASQGREADKLGAVIDDLLVNFVRQHEYVLFQRHFREGLQFLASVNRAGRV